MATGITRRFPRPMGLTPMSLEYQKDHNPETLSKLMKYFISQWFLGSGAICGVSYDINSLASRFNVDPAYIKEYMRDNITGSRIWTRENQEELINGLLGESLMWAMEDRMEVVQQVNLLKASQGGKYTPFVSAELNKALKLRMDATTSLQNAIRNLTGGNTTNIFAQFNQQNNVSQEQAITIEEARELITQVQLEQPKGADVKLLETKYDLSALPEVVATQQSGVDTSKEGLNLNKAELNAITDDYKGALEVSSKEHHELRREIEEGIDQDAEDPELFLYDEPIEEEAPMDPLTLYLQG